MNLVVHQLRKDLRQQRFAALVWLALLAADLAVSMGWLGGPGYDPRYGLEQTLNLLRSWLLALLWILLLLLPALVVLADSPAKTNGFLSTRPLPKRALVAAKALFVALVVVAPPVLQEGLHLTLKGLAPRYVLHGTLERLLYVAPLAFASAGFAGLWAGFRQWKAALVCTLLGVWLLGLAVVLVVEAALGPRPFLDSTVSSFLVWLCFLAVALPILAWLNHRRRWQLWRRGLALGALTAVSFGILFLWPWNFFPPEPGEPATVAALAERARFDIPLRQLRLACTPEAKFGRKVTLSVHATPRFEPLPEDCVAEWLGRAVELTTTRGRTLTPKPPWPEGPIFGWRSSPSLEDLRTFAHGLAPGTLFHAGSSGTVDRGQVFLGAFDFGSRGVSLEEPVSIKGTVEARVFRWEKSAEIPLAQSRTAGDATGSWSLLFCRHLAGPGTIEVILQRDQVSLWTSRHLETAHRGSWWPAEQYEILLVHPGRAVAWCLDNRTSAVRHGTHTAYQRALLVLTSRARRSFEPALSAADLPHLRLAIFRKHYLGAMRKDWASAAFVPADFRPAPQFQHLIQTEPLSTAEFYRRWARVSPLSASASRLEVGRYLNEGLMLLGARQQSVNFSEPVFGQFTTLVPAHLPVFLDGMAAGNPQARHVLMAAISRGADERQKGDLIAALRRQPELAEVLLARGWLEEARGVLEQLLQTPRPLPFEVVRAVAWFEDPQSYPRLLDELEARPDLDLYDCLRRLPGIEADLNRAVERVWRNRPRAADYENVSPALEVALRHGKHEALAEVYRLFETLPPTAREPAGPLVSALKRSLVLRGLQPEDHSRTQRVVEWLAQHRADEFRFDPARRRFVLLPKTSLAPRPDS